MKEQQPKLDKTVIKIMPTKELLEEFIDGFSQSPTVIFNRETGEFERTILKDPIGLENDEVEQMLEASGQRPTLLGS